MPQAGRVALSLVTRYQFMVLHSAWPGPAMERIVRHAIQKFHGDERLDKCLEKNRNLRYQHAPEIRTDLQRLKRDVQPASVVSPIEADAKPRMAKMLTPTFPS
jgi:hypothetical protein